MRCERHAHAAGEGFGGPAEGLLEAGIARAEEGELHVHARHDVRKGLGEEIQAFLAGEAGYDAENGDVRVFREAEAFLKGGFGGRFACGERARIVGARQVFIHRRIPRGGVDAVEDADEVGGAEAKHFVEAETAGGSLDLLGVGWADGGELRGVVEPGLHHVDSADAFEAVGTELGGRQMGEVDDASVGVALVLEIVDRKYGGGSPERGVAQRGVEQHGQEAGGPVVGVHHVGNPAELEAEIQRAAAEEGEAQIVVRKVAPRAGVNLWAREELLVFKGVNRDLGAREDGFPSAGPTGFGADVDAEWFGAGVPGGIELEAAVSGEDDADVMPEGGEGLGERADHVGQASHFDERLYFGRNEEDFERDHGGGGKRDARESREKTRDLRKLAEAPGERCGADSEGSRREQAEKKTPRAEEGRGGKRCTEVPSRRGRGRLCAHLAQRGVAMAAGLEKLGAAVKRAVEFIDEEVDGLVGVFRRHSGHEIGAADFDMALGYEDGATARVVVFEVDADAVYIGSVAKKAFGFGAKLVAQGIGEAEVDSTKDKLRAGVSRTIVSHAKVPTRGRGTSAV